MWRWLRALWPLVFLLPLGVFAGRLCWLNLADPLYHGLVWLHERLVPVALVLATVSVAAALSRFLTVQIRMRTLLSFCVGVPPRLRRAFERERGGMACELRYIDVPHRFCFTTFGGPKVVVSRGFEERLNDEELAFVLRHELLHVRRRDPRRSIAWHLLFAGLILPGFDAVEEALHMWRERAVDRTIQARYSRPERYRKFVRSLALNRDDLDASICTRAVAGTGFNRPSVSWKHVATRFAPALLSVGVFGLVLFSHAVFMKSLPYLQAHHC